MTDFVFPFLLSKLVKFAKKVTEKLCLQRDQILKHNK